MWVRVARIGKPSGLHGRVTVQLFTDAPDDRLRIGAALGADDTGAAPLVVRWVGRSGARWVVAFDDVTDRDAAEALRGRDLFAEVAESDSTSGPDEWFDWQLAGLPCMLIDGTPVGEVVRVDHLPAHDVLLVGNAGGPLTQVPFVAEIVREVTTEALVLDPPAGLFDADLAVRGEQA